MILALAVVSLVAACGPGTGPTASGSSLAPSPTGSSIEPIGGVGAAGPFRLALELPKATWQTDQPITGVATLSIIGLEGHVLSGSGGGLIVFDYRELGGRRHVEPVSTADCVPHAIGPADPIVEPLGKSGGFDGADPDATFYRAFLQGPDVRLPPGAWRITAIATFIDDAGCDGQRYSFEVPVTVTVAP